MKTSIAVEESSPSLKWFFLRLRITIPVVAVLLTNFPARAEWPPATNPPYQEGFPIVIAGDFIRFAAVSIADLNRDGNPDIVIGGSDGIVHAYSGDGTHLWSTDTGGMAFESKAAIVDVDADEWPEIIIGAGSTFTPSEAGRLVILDHLGVEQCHFDPLDTTGDGIPEGIISAPAAADLDGDDGGRLEIVFGGWDQRIRALHDDCSVLWEREAFDTIWSSPAIGDLDGDGDLEVAIGADSHYEPQPIGTEDGGRLFVLDGRTGTDVSGFPKQVDEVITSSPALGDLDGDGDLEIIVGTGNCWGTNSGCGIPFHPGVGEYLLAWHHDGTNVDGWPVATSGQVAQGSPALGNLDGDRLPEVVINTRDRTTDEGWVYVLNGDGTFLPGWPVKPTTPANCDGGTVSYATNASPILVNVAGDSLPEIILPSNSELVIWDAGGNQLTRAQLVPPTCSPPDPESLLLGTSWSVGGTPAATDLDGDGDLEVVAGGYEQFLQVPGAIWAWDPGNSGDHPWPSFRKSEDNIANFNLIFSDGFERGSLTSWSAAVP